MNPVLPSPAGVPMRMAVTIAALAPLLVVESFARGATWLAALLSGIVLAWALAWVSRSAQRQPRTPLPAQLDLVVIALLIALLLPAGSSWMVACVAVSLAVLPGRAAYGGLGQALCHPAMVGLAGATLIFSGTAADAAGWSAWAAPATWLGACVLVLRGIVAWRTPLAFLLGAAGAAAVLSPAGVSPLLAALAVASHPAWVLGAFFIAGDTTTGCLHPRARTAFGLGAGLMVVAFDHWQPASGLPMAILAMNFVAPWLDQVLAKPMKKALAP